MCKRNIFLEKMTINQFPEFSANSNVYVKSLKNYALPDFILKLVANECSSDLVEKGKVEKKLQSMNDKALELLYKIFVECNEDGSKNFALYRFYAYVASMYYKCEVLVNEKITGKSQKNYKIPISIKNNGLFYSIAVNKDSGRPVTKNDITKFYNMVDDIKQGEQGTLLMDAIFASSVGFKGEALVELERLINTKEKGDENKLNFKIANYENRIYSLV
jgi:hypothetical protein